MKKIFYILASAIVALGAVACENDVMDNIATVEGDTVSFVAAIDDTKTDLTADNKTIWDEDDTISITWTDAKGERTDVFSNKETGDQNKFTCTADGLAAITEAEVVATYSHNGDGKIDSEAGKAGSLLAYSGAFTELKFQVQNAFLKFTAAEGDVVTLTASEKIFSTTDGTTFNIVATGEAQYVAILPATTTITYAINEVVCTTSKENALVAGKIYNLGTLNAPAATVKGVAYETLAAALEAAENGDTVILTKDAELESSEILTIDKNITLDGNGATISSTAERAINVNTDGAVTIQNLTIVATGQRAVNVIQKPATVTLSGVNFTADNYTVNVAASAGEAKVFIENSTLYGLNVVNVQGPGAEVTLTDCTVNCTSNAEKYAALCLGKDAVGGSIEATGTTINVEEPSVKGRNEADGGTVTINGSTADVDVQYAIIDYPQYYVYHSFATVDEAIEFNLSEYDGQHEITLLRDATIATVGTHKIDVNGHTLTAAEGYILTDNGEKSYTVVAAVAKVDTNYYATFDAALAAAEEGATIELLADAGDVTISQACTINAGTYNINITVEGAFVKTVEGNVHTIEAAAKVWLLGDWNGWAAPFYMKEESNYYVAHNVVIEEGQGFKFNDGTMYLGGASTANAWNSFSGSDIKLSAATYDIYVSKRNGAWCAVTAGSEAPALDKRYMYLKPDTWDTASPKYVAWCTGGTSANKDLSFSWAMYEGGKNYQVLEISDYKVFYIKRMSSDGSTKWNEVGPVTIGDNSLVNITGWSTYTLGTIIP